MKKTYVLYQSDSESSFSFFEGGHPEHLKHLAEDARLVWSVEASSWDEAQALKHEHLGWEPYVPPVDGEANEH